MPSPTAERVLPSQGRKQAVPVKRCRRCQQDKPLAHFYRSPKTSDGLHPWCSDCFSAYNAARRAARPKPAPKPKPAMPKAPPQRHARTPRVEDKIIGAIVRQARERLGMSQIDFGRALGVTYQQAHKYERGLNRMSGAMLLRAAALLHLDLAEVQQAVGGGAPPARPEGTARYILEIAATLQRVRDRKQLAAIAQLVRTMASHGLEEAA